MTPRELAKRRPRAAVYVAGTPGMFGHLMPSAEELGELKYHASVYRDGQKLERDDLSEPGTTVYFKNVGRRLSVFEELADSLAGVCLCRRVEVALVLSWGGQGFSEHRDPTDLLVLQISGSKLWRLEGYRRLTMNDGDVLFLPRGYAHSCESEGPSAHATFQFV